MYVVLSNTRTNHTEFLLNFWFGLSFWEHVSHTCTRTHARLNDFAGGSSLKRLNLFLCYGKFPFQMRFDDDNCFVMALDPIGMGFFITALDFSAVIFN